MKLHRDRKRLGLRPVQVLVSEQDIDYLLGERLRAHPDGRSLDRRGGIRFSEQFGAGGGIKLLPAAPNVLNGQPTQWLCASVSRGGLSLWTSPHAAAPSLRTSGLAMPMR